MNNCKTLVFKGQVLLEINSDSGQDGLAYHESDDIKHREFIVRKMEKIQTVCP